jgi:hypothetical protein
MRAPAQSFGDAIDAFLCRHSLYPLAPPLPEEQAFFDRVRRCANVPPARTANDYRNLADHLSIAWEVANVWPRSAEIARKRRETAARQLDAIRKMRKDEVPFDPAVKHYLECLEHLYTAQLRELEPDEISELEYVRHDHLAVADLGRKRRGAGPMLFVREISAAMREIFGRPYDKVVGELAGLAFDTETLSVETVRTMRKKTGWIQPE